VTDYKAGNYLYLLKSVGGKEKKTAQEALYLGLSHLRLGEAAPAIDAWKEFVRLKPGGEEGREIAQYLTLLMQDEAIKSARETIASEAALSGRGIDPKAVAVSPFQNLGTPVYAPLSKGLAEMVITDLSKVKTLKVVERIRLQALINELKLAQSGLVDAKTAPRLGGLVGAGKITTGSFLNRPPDTSGLSEEEMRLNAAVAETQSGLVSAPHEVVGPLAQFYLLEKKLVFKLLCDLGACPESLDEATRTAVETVHTKSLKAFLRYSEGIDFLDRRQYKQAYDAFFQALEIDPEFDLARETLFRTPIIPLDLTVMIAGAESIGAGEPGILVVHTPTGEARAKAMEVPNEGGGGVGPSGGVPGGPEIPSPVPPGAPIGTTPVIINLRF
jgi:tetratricopeptide (TPR) repeat protein